MNSTTAQLSLYPLRRQSLGPAIDRALEVLHERGLEVDPGRMSTLVSGSTAELFRALEEIFEGAAKDGDVVMVVTLSTACPRRAPNGSQEKGEGETHARRS